MIFGQPYAVVEGTRVDHLPTCGGAPSSAIAKSGLLRMREASACLPASSKDLRELIELGSQRAMWLSERPAVHVKRDFFARTADPFIHRTNGNLQNDWHSAKESNELGIRDENDRAGGGWDSTRMLNKSKRPLIILTMIVSCFWLH